MHKQHKSPLKDKTEIMCLVGSPPIVLCIYSAGENGADFLSSFAPPRSTCTSERLPPPVKPKAVTLRKEGDRLPIPGEPGIR